MCECVCVFVCVHSNMQTHSFISSLGDLGVTEVHVSGHVIAVLMHQSMHRIIHHHGDAEVLHRNVFSKLLRDALPSRFLNVQSCLCFILKHHKNAILV